MRMILVSHSSQRNGAENVLVMLADGLRRAGHELLVVMPEPGPIEGRLRDCGINIKYVPVCWWVGAGSRDVYTWQKLSQDLHDGVEALVRIIQEEHIDLVISNTAVIIAGALAARACKVPHIWYIHEILSAHQIYTPLVPLPRFYALMDLLTERTVVVSKTVEQEIRRFVDSDKVAVIRTGIPSPRYNGPAPGKGALFQVAETDSVVVFVGMLSKQKNVQMLPGVAERVLHRHPNAVFALVGPDGGEERRLVRQVKQRGLAKAFRVLGSRDDVSLLLKAADIFVFPSLSDSFPLAVLEAMGAGLPVVATRSGGCEEMIVDGESGYLVDVAQPEAMADRIMTLLQNPYFRNEMGQKAERRFEQCFSSERYIREFGQLADQVVLEDRDIRRTAGDEALRCIRDLLQSVAERRAELAWMKTSYFWRLRQRVVAVPGVRQLADRIRRSRRIVWHGEVEK